MKTSFRRLPSALVLEIFRFLNFISLSALVSVEKYLLDILIASPNAKRIDKMIQNGLVQEFPYLKSESCALELQGSPLYRNFQYLKKRMEQYYHHFPLHSTQPLKDKSFWVQFNLGMGLGFIRLMVKNYLLIQEEYDILFIRDYQGDNLIAGLHKRAIHDQKENQQNNRFILEDIFQSYTPQILGSYDQRNRTVSENISAFLRIFPHIQHQEKNVAVLIKLWALSLACHQGEVAEVIQKCLAHNGYLNQVKWVSHLCQQLVKYGAYFALSKWTPWLATSTALDELRELAWSLRDFNCFRLLHSADLNYIPFLKKYYHPLAFQLILQFGLNILELSNEMIRRILTTIFLSEDHELLGLFFKNWNKQIQSTPEAHELTVRGNQIVGVILQKHKLMGQTALFKLMHWLVSNQFISLEKKYYPYYINRPASVCGNKTLFEIATLCKLPHLVDILLRLGAAGKQRMDERAVEESRNIRKNICQDLLSVHLFKSKHHQMDTHRVTHYVLATPALVIKSGHTDLSYP